MAQRQFTRPMIIRGGNATALHRVRFDDRAFNEDQLQQLLYENPMLLPTGEVEPIFDGLISVARELPTPAGPLDLLYVTPDGFLALAETKLWRNPEARRSVVAQIIDYTKEMARWSYDDLVEAVRKATSTTHGDALVARVREAVEGEFDEAAFHDHVSRNLKLGRFLLLIIGDGIREDVESMAEHLQNSPQLGYTLALIEIALYRTDPDVPDPLIVQPRIIARTQEVTRAVVEIRNKASETIDVSVTLPKGDDGGSAGPRETLTEAQFFEDLTRNTSPEVADFVKEVLDKAPEHNLSVKWGSGGPSLGFVHSETGHRFSIASFLKTGDLWIGWLKDQCKRRGVPEGIAQQYYDLIGKEMDGVTIKEQGVQKGRKSPTIKALMPFRDKWFQAVDRAIEQIRDALETA